MKGVENKKIREGGDSTPPNPEMTLNGSPKKWALIRTTATLLKCLSSCWILGNFFSLFFFQTQCELQSRGLALLSTATILGHGIEIFDLRRQAKDYQTHNLREFMISERIRDSIKKAGDDALIVNNGNQKFDATYITNIFYKQIIQGLLIGIEVITLTRLLSKVGTESLIGRVVQRRPIKWIEQSSAPLLKISLLTLGILHIAQTFHTKAKLKRWTCEEKPEVTEEE